MADFIPESAADFKSESVADMLRNPQVYAGGRERTEAEHRDLLASAGFALDRVVPTASGVSLLEALPR